MTVAERGTLTNTKTTRAAEYRSAALANQASQLAEHYPELYEHLRRRDRAIERALARIPSRADVELASVFNARRYLEKTMKNLAPGVGDLNGIAVPEPVPHDDRTEAVNIDG